MFPDKYEKMVKKYLKSRKNNTYIDRQTFTDLSKIITHLPKEKFNFHSIALQEYEKRKTSI